MKKKRIFFGWSSSKSNEKKEKSEKKRERKKRCRELEWAIAHFQVRVTIQWNCIVTQQAWVRSKGNDTTWGEVCDTIEQCCDTADLRAEREAVRARMA